MSHHPQAPLPGSVVRRHNIPSRLIVLIILWAALPATARSKPEALFYYVPSEDGWASLVSHASQIPLLAPQVFILQEDGTITGTVEERVLGLAASHQIRLMPLLANAKPEAAHNLLVDPARRTQVIAESLRLCRQVGCVGLQMDIEGILDQDGQNFTDFIREAAQAFHGQHLQLTVALPTPLLTPAPGETYAEYFGGFVVYREPYRLEQIAPLVDFISLMTYGQHGNGTLPGPVAGHAWVEQSIQYALQFVPPEKLSMGLGFWAYRWCGTQITYSGYSDVESLMVANRAAVHWHGAHRSPWFDYEREGRRTTVWFENRRSLREKLKLVKHYHLRGFSGWRLGQEDPAFWREMRERK
jgi:spore germination protein YaaH